MSRATGSRYTVEVSPQISDYHEAVKDVIDSDEVLKLKEFCHHRCMTRFQHCLNVSYYSFLMCRKLGLKAEQAARAGLLHDLYEDCPKCTRRHLVDHPEKALENALESFKLTKVEQDIIVKHMWPIRKGVPKYPESMVVMLTDKYIALMEFCISLKQSARNIRERRAARRQ